MLMGGIINNRINPAIRVVALNAFSQAVFVSLRSSEIRMDGFRQVVPFKVTTTMRCVWGNIECDQTFRLIFILPVDRASAIQNSDLKHSSWANPFQDGIQSRHEGAIFVHENDVIAAGRRAMTATPEAKLNVPDRHRLWKRDGALDRRLVSHSGLS
jgi:hypothetical protein